MTPLAALLPGSAGRWPFAGHVRGLAPFGGSGQAAWAARVGAGLSPEEAWEAAEALRDTFAAWAAELPTCADATQALSRLWPHLRTLPARWAQRDDLSLLACADDGHRVLLSGAGLAGVYVETPAGLVVAALSGSPLLGEPGFPASDPWPQPPLRVGRRYLGLPPGLPLPTPERLDLACGVHP